MNGKQLKNSILQWAIQGKLVPQDPNDEPASELLRKIREEKARLVKEGKIKKDKNESIIYRGDDNSHYEKLANGTIHCIDEEIPFEIPSTWTWCRLGSLVDFSKSSSTKAANICKNAWLLDLEDIEKDTGRLLQKKRMGDTLALSDKHSFKLGNVLYSKLRPYLNKVIVADEDGFCTSEILCFDFGTIYNRYAQLYLMSPYFVEYAMSDAYGVKMPRLGSKQGNNALMPIPPLCEQYRIIKRIDELQSYIDRYKTAQDELDGLNNYLFPALKKSILQEAIQGKLVPQDPSEKPAKELLKLIRTEKEKLVAEGKLKRKDIVDSNIFKGDDNKYYEKCGNSTICIDEEFEFEIPQGWELARIASIALVYTGNSISETEKKRKYTNVVGREYVGTKDVGFDCKVQYNNGIAIPKQYEDNFKIAPAESVLMCIEGGSAGRKIAIIDKDICFGNKLCCFAPFVNISKFIFYYLQSPFFFEMFNNGKTGIIGGVSVNTIKNMIIPIPPYQEMQRILAKLEQALASIMSR